MIRLMVEEAELVCRRAEGQVAGFCDTQRGLDRLQVSHFADQHHVRIFTERGAQRVGETLGVGVQLALVHQAVLVHVNELDRVLDGEDVIVPLGVDLVDHGGQRGGLARAGRPGHQHQPARLVAQLADHRRQTQLVERLDLKGNETEDGRGRAALVERLARKRASPFRPKEKSSSKFSSKRCFCASVMTL